MIHWKLQEPTFKGKNCSLELTPTGKGGNNVNDTVASPEKVPLSFLQDLNL